MTRSPVDMLLLLGMLIGLGVACLIAWALFMLVVRILVGGL